MASQLPYRVRWQDLKDLFRRAGTVLRADVSLTPDNRSRGYGTVLLASAEDAGRAVDMFNGYSWQGRILEVRLDRLGAPPAGDLDPTAGAIAASIGVPTLPVGLNVNGLSPNVGALGPGSVNGLHVPSPHPALPLPTGSGQNLGASPISSASGPSLLATGTLAGVASSSSPLNAVNPAVLLLQQQQQAAQLEREREDFLLNQAAGPGRPGRSSLDPFLLGRGLSVDSERDRPRSNQGMRNLFVGNVSIYCFAYCLF